MVAKVLQAECVGGAWGPSCLSLVPKEGPTVGWPGSIARYIPVESLYMYFSCFNNVRPPQCTTSKLTANVV